jgi:hypothetical protein
LRHISGPLEVSMRTKSTLWRVRAAQVRTYHDPSSGRLYGRVRAM